MVGSVWIELIGYYQTETKYECFGYWLGLGFPLVEIAQRLGSSSKVFGIDPWDRVVERTNLKINKYGIKNVMAIKGVAEKLPFKNEFFDLIVSNNGINNVEGLQITLSECYRVCKSNAQFTFTFNLEDSMIEFYSVFEETLRQNELTDEIQKMKLQIYSKRKPLNETNSGLEEAGFSIKNIDEDQFQLRFLDGTTMFNHSLIKYWFLDGWKSVLNPNDLESIFEQLERRLNEIAKENGEIRLTIPFVTIDCRKL